MVNDYFKGSEVSTLNADKFALEHLDKGIIKEDLEVMERKFWDYKLWHPMVATMYFVHRYHTIAAKVIEREEGTKAGANYRRYAAAYDLRKQKLATIRAFWKARQHADAIGCTYDVYVRAAIRHFRANIKLYPKPARGKQYLPFATQLYSKAILNQAILDWTEEKKKRFPLPESTVIPNNTQLWFRPEMEAWLLEEAKKHEYGKHYIGKARDNGILLHS